mgnify:CR=1 FL=1
MRRYYRRATTRSVMVKLKRTLVELARNPGYCQPDEAGPFRGPTAELSLLAMPSSPSFCSVVQINLNSVALSPAAALPPPAVCANSEWPDLSKDITSRCNPLEVSCGAGEAWNTCVSHHGAEAGSNYRGRRCT